MLPELPKPREVVAYNTAHNSENKMHEDTVARQYGFSGALVPGVDVYAYMSHAAVSHWGEDWLGRGVLEVRFLKPVYEAETVRISADCFELAEASESFRIKAECRGEICAEATARLPEVVGEAPSIAAFPRHPMPDPKPLASPASLAPGTQFGTLDRALGAADASDYLGDVREDLPLYAEAGLVHPGWLAKLPNQLFVESIAIVGPRIHAASEIRHFQTVKIGEPLSARARVAEVFERRGHKFVAFDVLVLKGAESPVMMARHTSIYAPRRAA